MRLSAPIFQLKRRAKLMARAGDLPLHEALDKIAREEGFARWSLLSSRFAGDSSPEAILSRLENGDLVLMAGRPGHGKTVLGLRLLLDAVRLGRGGVLFTLEFTEGEARHHLRQLDDAALGWADKVDVVTSEAICADLVMRHLADAAPGTVAIVDYLQILDQQRSKPALADQIQALSTFASETGVILGFLSQIDRAFDPDAKRLPDIGDIRLPNRVDLGLFTKAVFLHGGEAGFQRVV